MSRLLLVSNRLPITVRRRDGKLEVAASSGGLATGLAGPHAQTGGLWFGWPGAVGAVDAEERAFVMERLKELRCAAVPLSGDEVERFYEGICNAVLWPALHGLLDPLPLETPDLSIYEQVNARFADAVAGHWREGDVIWIHDFHLMRLPALLRERLPSARIGFFLHIPFPPWEGLQALPWRRELLEGLLGADLIGVHTPAYVRHLADAFGRELGLEFDIDRVRGPKGEVRLGFFPMGIDAAAFEQRAATPAVEAEITKLRASLPDGPLLLGVDRLDYTKGLRRRFRAVDQLLQQRPELRGRLTFLQVCVPSRERVGAYRRFRESVEREAARLQGRWSTPTWSPVRFLHAEVPPDVLSALYRCADVLLVTALRDGMNLVAKEFVASRTDGGGSLLLSSLAGAALDLAEADVVEPYDVTDVAKRLGTVLDRPPAETQRRMRVLRDRVRQHDVHAWSQGFLKALNDLPLSATKPRAASGPTISAIAARLREAPKLLVLLDHDGTLVPLVDDPGSARPAPEVLELLKRLAELPGREVHIVSGRDRSTLLGWYAGLQVGLHAEHGAFSMDTPGGSWSSPGPQPWKGRVRPLLEGFAARTAGAFVEEKEASLVFHHRLSDPVAGERQAQELRRHLGVALELTSVQVRTGRDIVEVRPIGFDKGRVGHRLTSASNGALVLAAGDDRTDADLFAALPPEATTVVVGDHATHASLRLRDPAALHELLRLLVERPDMARATSGP